MKRIIIFFFIIFATTILAQEVRTQKDFLEIPNTDLVKDFNLKVGNGNIVPINISKATYKDIGFSFVGHKFQYIKDDYSLDILTFKNQKLIQSNSTYNYGKFMKSKGFQFTYTYNSDGNLSKRTSKASDSDYISDSFYTYSNNKISKTREKGTYADGKKYDEIINYIHDGNSISYNFKNRNKIFLLKNKLITTETTFSKSGNKTYINTYKYNNNGILINQDRGSYQATYIINDKNLIEKEVNKTYTKTFDYVYDKYGNWVIAYTILTSDKKLYGSQFSYYIREIKYSNSDITGSINPDDNDIKTTIIKLRSELFDRLVEENVIFRKTTNESYLFQINSQPEALKTTSVFMGRSLLVFHKPSKQLYILENFEDKPVGKDFPAKKVSIDLKNGFWYKTQKGGVHVFRKDGSYIEKVGVYEFATNNIDAIFQGEKEPEKVVLENYKNIKIYTPYPVLLYRDYNAKDNMTDSAKKLAKSLDEYSEYYTGECIKGDCENGYGEKEFKDGKTASGFFKDGKVYGPINTVGKNDKKSSFSVFKGSFKDQKGFAYEYNGDNLMIFTDKSKNIGFYNDYKTKKTYQLNYSNGEVISKKELQYNNSKTCVVGNCSSGIGIYEYSNSTYLGTFKSGKRDGFGYLFFKSGENYIGEFYNGNYSGLGTYTKSDQEYYMGYYQNGKAHGQGVQYYTKNTYKAGNWVNGTFEGKKSSKNNTNTSTIINNENVSFNIFDEKDTKWFKESKSTTEETRTIARHLNSRLENKTKYDTEERYIMMANYIHSLYNINPDIYFAVVMKLYSFKKEVVNKLPKHVQTDLKKRASNLANGYKKHLKKQGY